MDKEDLKALCDEFDAASDTDFANIFAVARILGLNEANLARRLEIPESIRVETFNNYSLGRDLPHPLMRERAVTFIKVQFGLLI